MGLCYDKSNWPKQIVSLNDLKYKDIYRWLESVLYLVEIPFESRPKGYNSQKINNLKDAMVPRADKVRMVKALSDASELCWNGIVNKDIVALGKGLTQTMYAWQAMLPATVQTDDKKLTAFWKKYEKETDGCLFSGAGGGYLFVVSDKNVENGFKIKINNDYYCTKNNNKNQANEEMISESGSGGVLLLLDKLIKTIDL